METLTLRTLSIYIKKADDRFAQISIGSDLNAFANINLEHGVLGTSANVESSITPAGNGGYRCTMPITSALVIYFFLYLTTAANPIRAQSGVKSDISLFLTDGIRPSRE